MNFTNGRNRNSMARVYDRLRKRSLRALHSGKKQESMLFPAVGTPFRAWEWTDHYAYVAGVRDALNAVNKEGR